MESLGRRYAEAARPTSPALYLFLREEWAGAPTVRFALVLGAVVCIAKEAGNGEVGLVRRQGGEKMLHRFARLHKLGLAYKICGAHNVKNVNFASQGASLGGVRE